VEGEEAGNSVVRGPSKGQSGDAGCSPGIYEHKMNDYQAKRGAGTEDARLAAEKVCLEAAKEGRFNIV
jgi:hypothetical protein